MTSARSLKPLIFCPRFSALCVNLNTMDKIVVRDTAFLVLLVLKINGGAANNAAASQEVSYGYALNTGKGAGFA